MFIFHNLNILLLRSTSSLSSHRTTRITCFFLLTNLLQHNPSHLNHNTPLKQLNTHPNHISQPQQRNSSLPKQLFILLSCRWSRLKHFNHTNDYCTEVKQDYKDSKGKEASSPLFGFSSICLEVDEHGWLLLFKCLLLVYNWWRWEGFNILSISGDVTGFMCVL